MSFTRKLVSVCIVVLLLISVTGSIYVHQTRKRVAASNAKFDSINRAINAINGAVSVGVSYDQYGKLLQSLSAELFQLRDQPLNEPEKRVFSSYESVLESFRDAATVWQQKFSTDTIKYGDNLGLGTDEIFVNPYDSDGVVKILNKYQIQSSPLRLAFSTELRKANATSAIRQIWTSEAVINEVTKGLRVEALSPKWLGWLDAHHLEWL